MAESGKKAVPTARAPKPPLPAVASGAAVPRPAAPAPPPPPVGVAPKPQQPVSVPPAAVQTADTDINVANPNPNRQTRPEDLASAHAVPTVGDRIGKYIVERVIGSGGMGLVVAARHEALGELVAIKLLRPKAAGDKVHSERFAREARAIIKIKSEHVVRVLDAGTLEDGGAPYIVMEYLVGRDLAQTLRAEGPMYPSRAADLMLQVCEAVASAHAVGVVHRDLKPSNFFITQRADGTTLVKVLDFGISKAMGQDGVVDPNLTETQAVFGSPTYMSPEQIRSAKHVDHRSDVWSLGIGLYELLTGKLPFAADNVAGLLASIIADPPFFPRGFAPNLPQELEDLLLACLQKDPKQRVQSVVDLAMRLAPFATPNVETHNLVERIQRLGNMVSGQQSGSTTTTGPKLPQPYAGPGPVPVPSSPSPLTGSSPAIAPSGAWLSNVDPRASGMTFGSTGMDLSAEAPPPASGRGMIAGIVIGVAVAMLLLVGGIGAYYGVQRGGGKAPTELPTISSITPPPSASTVLPSPSAPDSATALAGVASAKPSALPSAANSANVAAANAKRVPKHPPKAATAATPTAPPNRPSSDPTNDRF